MVDPREDTRQAINDLMFYVAGMHYFERKQEVMDALLNLEWKLRPIEKKREELDSIDEEIHDGHEAPWGD